MIYHWSMLTSAAPCTKWISCRSLGGAAPVQQMQGPQFLNRSSTIACYPAHMKEDLSKTSTPACRHALKQNRVHGCTSDSVWDLNLQDLPGALDDAAVAEGLNLHAIKNRDWAIFKTSAIKGEGLFEGLDWLSNQLKTRKR